MVYKQLEILENFKKIHDLEVINNHSDLKRLSRDFYNYSPVLTSKLDGCIADLVVRPKNIQAVLAVAKKCWEMTLPLTIRGSGTGNYGQSVPLFGGIVMQMNYLNKIVNFDQDTGFVKVQTGCLMSQLNNDLEGKGRELRLLPSTWKTATIGGFLSGGSGGIGSIEWGFLRDPGNLIALDLITVDENPQLIQLETQQAEPINHAYGTNGIITSVTISTDIKHYWHSIVIDSNSLIESIDILKICMGAAIKLKLGTILEKEIVEQMPKWFNNKSCLNKVLIQSTLDGIKTIEMLCKKNNLRTYYCGLENDLEFGLNDLVWNHTTLQLRAKDKNWTYLQMLLPFDGENELINNLKKVYGKKILWHIEAVSQNGIPRLAALPVFKWTDQNELNKIINECKKYGAIIFNPHALTVEGGGLGVVDADQVKAKLKYDPKGLLNPGKLEGWIKKEEFII
tara:strand:+ start:598 stop:1953 length:1356 start_codon:yes stop_codon:yes gene_type:complete